MKGEMKSKMKNKMKGKMKGKTKGVHGLLDDALTKSFKDWRPFEIFKLPKGENITPSWMS